jgi:hypothetical protein
MVGGLFSPKADINWHLMRLVALMTFIAEATWDESLGDRDVLKSKAGNSTASQPIPSRGTS